MNRTLATSIIGCDIDEDDLVLNIEEDLKAIESQSQSKSNKKNATVNLDSSNDHVFKKPFEVDKEEIGLSQISSNIFEKTSLNDLFGKEDEDEEDEFIKSQPMFSSTQMTANKSEPVQKDAEFKVPLPPQTNKYQSSNLNSSVILSTSSITDLTKKKEYEPEVCETSVHDLDMSNTTIWNYATTNLIEQFKKLGFSERFLQKHSIGYYLKKVKLFFLNFM